MAQIGSVNGMEPCGRCGHPAGEHEGKNCQHVFTLAALVPGVPGPCVCSGFLPVRVDRCRSCNAEIVWLKTPRAKAMPTDRASLGRNFEEYNGGVFSHGTHTSHFATCPQAKAWRK